jgi:hypothetical protein
MNRGGIKRPESRIGGGLLLALLVLLQPGCGPRSEIQKAGLDQDIARDVSWELRKDPRFSDVNVLCTGGVVTLQGRVDSPAIEADAIRVAGSRSHGARVGSKLEIRPR